MQKECNNYSPNHFPIHDIDAIKKYASKYWDMITYKEASEEKYFEAIMPSVRNTGYLTKEVFVRLGRWKSTRNTRRYLQNTEAEVIEQSRAAYKTDIISEGINALIKLKGVQIRTATAILHWLKPDQYPILDFRVVGALGLQTPPASKYSDIAYYQNIAMRIHKIAKQHDTDLRTIDRALWAWHKHHS